MERRMMPDLDPLFFNGASSDTDLEYSSGSFYEPAADSIGSYDDLPYQKARIYSARSSTTVSPPSTTQSLSQSVSPPSSSDSSGPPRPVRRQMSFYPEGDKRYRRRRDLPLRPDRKRSNHHQNGLLNHLDPEESYQLNRIKPHHRGQLWYRSVCPQSDHCDRLPDHLESNKPYDREQIAQSQLTRRESHQHPGHLSNYTEPKKSLHLERDSSLQLQQCGKSEHVPPYILHQVELKKPQYPECKSTVQHERRKSHNGHYYVSNQAEPNRPTRLERESSFQLHHYTPGRQEGEIYGHHERARLHHKKCEAPYQTERRRSDKRQPEHPKPDQVNPRLPGREMRKRESENTYQRNRQNSNNVVGHPIHQPQFSQELEEAGRRSMPEIITAMDNMIALFSPRHTLPRTPVQPVEVEPDVEQTVCSGQRRRSSPVQFDFTPNRLPLSPPLVWWAKGGYRQCQQDSLPEQELQLRSLPVARAQASHHGHLTKQQPLQSYVPKTSSIPKLPKLEPPNLVPDEPKQPDEDPNIIHAPLQCPPMTRIEKLTGRRHSPVRLPPLHQRQVTGQIMHPNMCASNEITPAVEKRFLPHYLLSEPMRFRPVFMKPPKRSVVPGRQLLSNGIAPTGITQAKKKLPDHLRFGNFNIKRSGRRPPIEATQLKRTICTKPRNTVSKRI